ncbi:MAG: TIR domain-containing protein [Pseudomonadota bacterium]
MAYRNKTYVCFDGDNDIHYYRLMQAWSENKSMDFRFYDAHDLNTARDTSQEASIKAQLRERFANSKLLLVLIGDKTRYLTKFVKWEMEVALHLRLPIIGVNLNGERQQSKLCPGAIKGELALHVAYGQHSISHAMANWPAEHDRLSRERRTGPYFYNDSVYTNLGVQ